MNGYIGAVPNARDILFAACRSSSARPDRQITVLVPQGVLCGSGALADEVRVSLICADCTCGFTVGALQEPHISEPWWIAPYSKRLAAEAARRWHQFYLDYKVIKKAIQDDVAALGQAACSL